MGTAESEIALSGTHIVIVLDFCHTGGGLIRKTTMKPYAALKPVSEVLQKMPEFWRDLLIFSIVGVVAYVDVTTPAYIVMAGFYFFPIFLAIWYSRKWVVGLTVLAAVATSFHSASQAAPRTAQLWEPALLLTSLGLAYCGFIITMFWLKSTMSQLKNDTLTDDLTGLLSRRGLHELARFEFNRMARSGDPLTTAIIDLDNFKLVNDTQGHAAGDALLIAVSRVLLTNVRHADILARFGGDEFVIVLPSTDAVEAKAVLERVLEGLRNLLVTFDSRISASIGAVVVGPKESLSLDDVLATADATMYSIKKTSKDGLALVTRSSNTGKVASLDSRRRSSRTPH